MCLARVAFGLDDLGYIMAYIWIESWAVSEFVKVRGTFYFSLFQCPLMGWGKA